MSRPLQEDPARAYLVYVGEAADVVFPARQVCRLDGGLHLVVSALERSQLYHRVKRQMPTGAALLVAPLAEAPKFKGMAPGALTLARSLWPVTDA